MDINYTPLDTVSFQSSHKSFDISVVFLSLIVMTLAILAVLLFILIQKKLLELAYIPSFA